MDNRDNERLELITKAFVADLLAGLNTDDSFQNIIGYIMRELGTFTHSDKVCLYEAGLQNGSAKKMYQWTGENNDIEKIEMECIDNGDIAGWLKILNQNQLVVVEDRAALSDIMPGEYGIMLNRETNSVILIPIFTKDGLVACIDLANPDFSVFSASSEILLYLGRYVGSIYQREKINHKYRLFMEGIRSSNLSEFIVDCATMRYEAFRITRVLSNVIPEQGDWDWLRQFYADIIKSEYKEDLLRRTGRDYLETFLCSEKSTFTIDLEREVGGVNNWFRLEFSVVSLNDEGRLERFVLLVKDITQMKQEEEEHQQMIRAMGSIYTTSAMIDVPSRMVLPIKLSENARSFASYEPVPHNEILDAFCNEMVQKDYVEIIREFMCLDNIQERFKNTNLLTCEYQGTKIEWGFIILAPAKWNKDGSLEKVVFAVQDISEQKRREEWMKYKMEHDELTGTLNRTAFNRATKLLEKSVSPFALVLMDIDRFKNINDTYGHDVGDEVLIRLVRVLNEKLSASDKLFRLGGDEFAIIMNRCTISRSDSVKQLVESVNEVITRGLEGLPEFSVSAGVTFSAMGYDEMIYHNADKALYRTKDTTRRGCTVFEEI